MAHQKKKSGIISFNIDGIHPYDIGVLLDKMGVNAYKQVITVHSQLWKDLIFLEPQDFFA